MQGILQKNFVDNVKRLWVYCRKDIRYGKY